MNQKSKNLKKLAICVSLLAAVCAIAQLLMPALKVGEQGGSGYVYKMYTGIDAAFMCWPEFILGGQLIGPNAVLIAGIVGTILFGLFGSLARAKAMKKTSGIVSAVTAAFNAWFGITWLMLPTLVMNTAYDKFKEIVYYAKQQNMFGIHPFAIIVAVIALISAVVNAAFAYDRLTSKEVEAAKEKKAMTTKKAALISLPSSGAVIALVAVATILMNNFSGVMNNFFGQGAIKSSSLDATSASYYEGINDAENLTKEGSKAFAEKANATIVGEGVTLLKNENSLPLASDAKVTLLGANFNLADAMTAEGMDVLDMTVDAASNGLAENGWDDKADLKGHSDAAFVTIYRAYGEGADAKVLGPDEVRTDLSLSEAELELLDNACKNFDNVIVLIASSNVVEASYLTAGKNYKDPYYNTDKTYDLSNIKGALWLSSRIGDNGPEAVAQIIDGTINPSGHTVDTWISNLKNDPTFNNFGDFIYTNGDLTNGYKNNPYTPVTGYTSTTFVEYEEGIYSGYRYYETAAYEAENGNYKGFDYDEQVVYPFGYGLSYTDFEMEYDGEPTFDEASNTFTFNVKVTNTGDVAGKEVAEIYVNAPYTEGGIEKAHVLLAGFAKTSVLEPGASETVTITVNRDYITSYDYKDAKCYVLEEGDYNFILSENAHSWTEIKEDDSTKIWKYTLGETITYDENNKRSIDGVAAVNVMDDLTNWKFTDEAQTGTGYAVNFSRADFAGTYPTAPEGDDLVAQDRILEARVKFDPTTVDTTVDEIVLTDFTATELTLADMRGVDYDDSKWEDFIQQMSLDKLVEMYSNGNWQEVADDDNGVPRTVDLDGPQGLTAQALGTQDCQVYQVNIMIGATWNTEMASLMGESIANEMNAYGWTGWYGPAMNIHRSQFCGRNTEYYSEDAMLSGILGAAEVSTASEHGIICFNKHFAVNNQETNRQGNICTWVNEQTMRELYTRAWQYYVQEATMTVNYYETDAEGKQVMTSKEMPAANGIMTCYNLIGAEWGGACEEVTVTMLRDEFGFKGIALTDAINNATEYMDPTAGLYSGASDLCLSQVVVNEYDNDYATLKLQNAAKNVLYAKANSNALELNNLLPGSTVSYGLAPWQKGLIAGWVFAGLFTLCMIANLIRIAKKNKKAKA